jgi:hypothetical protein
MSMSTMKKMRLSILRRRERLLPRHTVPATLGFRPKSIGIPPLSEALMNRQKTLNNCSGKIAGR